jgi:hypothetical protein
MCQISKTAAEHQVRSYFVVHPSRAITMTWSGTEIFSHLHEFQTLRESVSFFFSQLRVECGLANFYGVPMAGE